MKASKVFTCQRIEFVLELAASLGAALPNYCGNDFYKSFIKFATQDGKRCQGNFCRKSAATGDDKLFLR